MSKRLEMARTLVTLLLVMGATAALLAAWDEVPGLLLGEPLGVRRLGSVDEAERSLRARLFLPAYFPGPLRWPPQSVRLAAGRTATVALTFSGAEGPSLVLAQTVGGAGPISPALFPPGELLASRPIEIRGQEGLLARILAEDGKTWNQISWEQGGRRLAIRALGPEELVIRMARSARREGP